NTTDVPASVTVEIYDSTGAMVGTLTSPTLNAQQGVNFGTRGPAGLGIDQNFSLAGAFNLAKGFAKIFSTSKNMMCSAIVVDLGSSPPASMVSLQVVAGTKQK